jgi:alkylation response protein AidB-like acyl-CoA dehydrogenase
MRSIAMCGSEEQKQRWLPAMTTMDKLIVGRAITGIGAFT